MKNIEVDEELYLYIASQTQHIGESASDILRRLLIESKANSTPVTLSSAAESTSALSTIQVGSSASAAPITADKVEYMTTLLFSVEFKSKGKAIDRWMMVLSSLYQLSPESFSDAAKVKGRTRVYFADNEQTLLASGNTTKPRSIPNTPFWVITNNNTNRKRQMVQQLMVQMGFDATFIDRVSSAI